MANVLLSAVSKSYDGLHAVREVDLEIRPGEFVVLLGPSGCGKTTTLRMIAGFVHPTSGKISIDGRDVTDVPPRSRNIGMVFQNYALFPNMTVGENIGFGLRQRRVPRATLTRKVTEMLELIQLSEKVGAYPSELSGGQQQRVALARALAFSPRVLLMDEPLGALDLKLRESMQVELRRIQQELGITSVLVTHDQQEAMTLGDRIVVMANGVIQQIGTPKELYHAPKNRFVSSFIGKNNILSGSVVAAEGSQCRLELAGGAVIIANAPQPCAVGSRLECAIRPELIEVGGSSVEPAQNAIDGIVVQQQFLGSVVNYYVRTPWGQLLIVEKTNEVADVGPGSSVRLSWPQSSTIAFAPEASVQA